MGSQQLRKLFIKGNIGSRVKKIIVMVRVMTVMLVRLVVRLIVMVVLMAIIVLDSNSPFYSCWLSQQSVLKKMTICLRWKVLVHQDPKHYPW